jgi:hypothetical protein
MEQFNQDLTNMEARLTDMEEKIDLIDTKLTQVVDAILGNPLTKAGGFIQDIEILKAKIVELEKQQLKYEEFKKKTMWTIGIVLAIGAIIQYSVTIYSSLMMTKNRQPQPTEQIKPQ